MLKESVTMVLDSKLNPIEGQKVIDEKGRVCNIILEVEELTKIKNSSGYRLVRANSIGTDGEHIHAEYKKI